MCDVAWKTAPLSFCLSGGGLGFLSTRSRRLNCSAIELWHPPLHQDLKADLATPLTSLSLGRELLPISHGAAGRTERERAGKHPVTALSTVPDCRGVVDGYDGTMLTLGGDKNANETHGTGRFKLSSI